MPIPTWSPGQVLVASDVNSWFVPLAVVKGGDQSVTSSTVVVNDTALVVAVASSATYQFSCFISYEGGTQGSSDLKWTWTTPAGTAMIYSATYLSNGGTAQVGDQKAGSDVLAAGTSGATSRTIIMWGTVAVAGTAGNVQLQWAQNASSGTATKVHANSWISLWRFA
jgi:hypothetical protein